MKVDEVKLRMKKFIFNTIDMVFPREQFSNKIKNATARYWVDQNIYRLDSVLNAFADKNNEINIDLLVNTYEDTLFENGDLKLDIKKIIPQDFDYLRGLFPDKLIIFKKEDLYNIFI